MDDGTWKSRRYGASTLDGCDWCRGRYRTGDVAVSLLGPDGSPSLDVHAHCLALVRASLPTKRAALAAAKPVRAWRPTWHPTDADDAP